MSSNSKGSFAALFAAEKQKAAEREQAKNQRKKALEENKQLSDHRPNSELSSRSELSSKNELSSPTPPIIVRRELSSENELSSPNEPWSPKIQVPWMEGYQQIPNYILDGLLPRLTQNEATVYLRLYRLSLIHENGKRRGWCVIGNPKLSEITHIQKTALFTALRGLEEKGLIEREAREVAKGQGVARGVIGNRYRVHEPELVGRPKSDHRSPRELSSRGEHMKENMKENMKAVSPERVRPPEEILALTKASIHEYRQVHTGATEDAVRGYLYRWANEIGIEITHEIVEEALRSVR